MTNKPTVNHGKATHLVRAPEGRAQAKQVATTAPAAPKTHTTSSQSEPYKPEKDMLAPPARHGASDALQVPSRMGNRLHYRDGRVMELSK